MNLATWGQVESRSVIASINESIILLLYHLLKVFTQYLLTLMLFQTSMCLFVLLNTKEDICN